MNREYDLLCQLNMAFYWAKENQNVIRNTESAQETFISMIKHCGDYEKARFEYDFKGGSKELAELELSYLIASVVAFSVQIGVAYLSAYTEPSIPPITFPQKTVNENPYSVFAKYLLGDAGLEYTKLAMRKLLIEIGEEKEELCLSEHRIWESFENRYLNDSPLAKKRSLVNELV